MNKRASIVRRQPVCCLGFVLLVSLSLMECIASAQEQTSPEAAHASRLAASAWAKFRGNARNTGLSKSKATASAEPWTRETPNKGMFQSPAVGEDGTLYIGADTLYALDGNTGKKKWEFNTGIPFSGSIALGSNGLLYTGNYNSVYALDSATGKKRWKVEAGDVNANPTVGADGTVYIGGGADKCLLALDGNTGKRKWTFLTKRSVYSAPALGSEDTVYLASDKVYALNPADGRVKWSFGMEGYEIDSSPALDDAGMLYVGMAARNAGAVIALERATGTLKWKFVTKKFVQGSPALGADGTLYVGCGDECVYVINSETGLQKWAFKTDGSVSSSPAIGADGTVYLGSSDTKFYALDSKTGVKRWEFEAGGNVFCSPVLGNNGLVYFSAFGGKIYALRQEDGRAAPPVFEKN